MPIPPARMGFVGRVVLRNTSSAGTVQVRATNADIRASQEIDHPEVVDGKIDRTLYQLRPRIVGGNISFPVIHEGSLVDDQGRECGNEQLQNQSLGQALWQVAARRDTFGRLVNTFDTQITYTDDTAFLYPSCKIDNIEMSVTQGEQVEMSVDVFGGANAEENPRTAPDDRNIDIDILSPARVVTWNDFLIRLYLDEGDANGQVVDGSFIRQFSVTLNNNLERYYTLNNKLSPQDITARKREIEGNVRLMGRNNPLGELAYTNQQRFTSTARIAFGYSLGSAGSVAFMTALHGVIFRIEEIEISNDLIETNVNFTALGDCDNAYEATEIGNQNSLPANQFSPGDFGGPTAVGFPNWDPES